MQSADSLAEALWAEARADGQSARTIESDGVAEAVRARIRELAKADGINVRTARMDGTVIAVRLDAAVWHEDAATMRRKLSPRDGE